MAERETSRVDIIGTAWNARGSVHETSEQAQAVEAPSR
jgi:hypothetical protein